MGDTSKFYPLLDPSVDDGETGFISMESPVTDERVSTSSGETD